MRCPPSDSEDGEVGVLPVFDPQGGSGEGGVQDQADWSNGWLNYGNPQVERDSATEENECAHTTDVRGFQ